MNVKLKLGCIVLFLFFQEQLFSQSCSEFEANSVVEKVFPQCNNGDGEIMITNTFGGVPPYQYELNGLPTQTGAFFELDTGLYPIQVTDARGCKDTITVELLYEDLSESIKPFNAFTPNEDGMNDRWQIPGIERYKNAEVRVFNRWGQQVYVNSLYSNSDGWDGTNNGAKLSSGTYFYIITAFSNCIESGLSGFVTLMK